MLSDTQQFKTNYSRNKSNKTVENILTNNSLFKLYNVRENVQKYNPVYNVKVTPKLNVTNQKSSGRCWLFAALNVIRREVCTQYNLDNFEFSQSYLFFWDKLERMNYNLECIINTRELDSNSRLVQHLLDDPTCDGGQWDMFANLVLKYGLVPQSVYQESYHSSNSGELNAILKKKFRQYAHNLRNETSIESLSLLKESYVQETYNLLCKFLGCPPTTFDWEYDNKEYHLHRDLTPLQFYNDFVNFKVDDYICLVNDPRQEHPYHKLYTVQYLGNVIDGNKVKYLNLPIYRIKELALDSLKQNQSVWFGCDVGKYLNKDLCSMDFNNVNYLDLLETDYTLDKEARLNYKDSLMTHAMVFTGANIDEEQVNLWEVENSWGKGSKTGYYSMSDDWFSEYVYEVAININDLNNEEKEILLQDFDQEFDPWDPMGALA
jgi:bleomycin hydrolase